MEYNSLLRAHGLRDHQVNTTSTGGLRALILLTTRITAFLVCSTVALPGVILNSPATLIINYISSVKARESKLKSQLKIEGRDVLASWKLIISFVLLPTLYSSYSLALFFLLKRYGYSGKWAILFWFSLPFVSYLTVRFQESANEIITSIKPLFFSLLPGKKKKGLELRTLRNNLRERIISIVNTLGPKIIKDFDQNRIIASDDIHQRRFSNNPAHNSKEESNVIWGMDKLDSYVNEYAYMTEKLVHRVKSFSRPLDSDLQWEKVSQNEIDDVFFK